MADDDPFARRVMRDALQAAGMTVVAEAGTGREALELALFYEPDVVVMDAVMPELDGIAATRRIVEANGSVPVIVLTGAQGDDMALAALRAGAAGFLSKDLQLEALPRALHGVLAGEAAISRTLAMRLVEHLRELPEGVVGLRPVKSRLTSREWEVLDLLCTGATNDAIARTLVLSPETVRSHLKRIFRKLGVKSRQDAAAQAARLRTGE